MSNAPVIAVSSDGLPVGPSADTFTLQGTACPGKCEMTSCEAVQAWDVREAYGFSWATAVPKGEKLTEPVFRVEIWEGGQYQQWLAFAATYLTRPAPVSATSRTVQGSAMPIGQPMLNAPPFSVTAVLFQSVAYRGRGEGGSFLFDVKFLEWKLPLPVGNRVDQQTPAVVNPPPTAKDEWDQAILEQTDTLQSAVLENKSVIPGWP